ncbi:MAG: AraC family transcriptional regulator [Bacteroidia bacterium]
MPFKIPVLRENSVIVEEDIQSHFYDYLHQHPETQLTWILKGEGTLLAGNYTGHFSSGEIYWLGQNQPHVFRCDPIYFQKKTWLKAQSISVFFDVSDVPSGLGNIPELDELKQFAQRSSRGYRIEPKDYVAVTEAFLRVRVLQGLQRLTAFLQLIDLILHHSSHQPLSDGEVGGDLTEREGTRMHAIFDYTLKNFNKEVTVGDAAEIVHMTPEAFCRFFKKHTHKTYITFLNEVRVEQACRRLKTGTDVMVSEIAYECGFGNVSHFNRVFRKVMNKTPREYQVSAQKNRK